MFNISQIRRMDLEARSLPFHQKAALLAKLREYKSDLTNLKREVKKSSASHALASRDDLMEGGMANPALVRICSPPSPDKVGLSIL